MDKRLVVTIPQSSWEGEVLGDPCSQGRLPEGGGGEHALQVGPDVGGDEHSMETRQLSRAFPMPRTLCGHFI